MQSPIFSASLQNTKARQVHIEKPSRPFLWMDVAADIDLDWLHDPASQCFISYAWTLAMLQLNMNIITCRVVHGMQGLNFVFQEAIVHMPTPQCQHLVHGILMHNGKISPLPEGFLMACFAQNAGDAQQKRYALARALRLQLMQQGGRIFPSAQTLCVEMSFSNFQHSV